MTKRESNGQLPPISGPRPEQGPEGSGVVPRVEGYDITGPLGEGGMGTVWRAVQLSTYRDVALKLLGRGTFASEKDRARFEREVELTARLNHPNIAQVYDSGVHQGVYYYAMELIDGLELDEYVKQQQLTQRQILELMHRVCEAVQHAHQRGIIHRDLKPSNILVTSDGQPHVLDFGLAKATIEGELGLKVSTIGEAPGTPGYMSPEQAAGKLDQIDTRTDLYALGVILFRLLTGETPHDLSGTRYEILRRVAEDEVRRPRDIAKDIDRELEALVLKALARDPKDRYASAGLLAQDIQNYLTSEPLTARPATTAYFLRKRIWKHRVPLAIGCSVLALLIGMGVFAYVRVADERTKAVAARDRLQKEADKANFVHDFLRAIIEMTQPAYWNERFALDRAIEEAEKMFAYQPEVQAAAHAEIGRIGLFVGELGTAKNEFERALSILGEEFEELGDNHADAIKTMGYLSITLSRLQKWDEWASICERLYNARLDVYGEEHPLTVRIMRNFAAALWMQGKLERAEAVTADYVDLWQRLHGDDDPWTPHYMERLAMLRVQNGNLEEAEATLREALRIRIAHQGEADPETLRTMNALALLLLQRGRFDEAKDWNRQTVEIRERAYGSEHPDTVWARTNLADLLKPAPRTARADGTLLARDGFDGKLCLDWEILHPAPSHFSLEKHPGTLTITTQEGDFSDSNTDYENLFLMDCPAAAGADFQLTTCVTGFRPKAGLQQAGLICFDDDDNYLKFVYLCNVQGQMTNFGRQFAIGLETEGMLKQVMIPVYDVIDKLWLRITKQGNRYTFSTSLDGAAFLEMAYPGGDETALFQGHIFWGNVAVKRVGLFATNGTGTRAPQTDAFFDFFEVRALASEGKTGDETPSAQQEHSDARTQ